LEPFSSQWFYGDTLFIIDVWLWALMGFATWFSLRREKRGGDWIKPARAAIVVALAYIGLNGLITFSAANWPKFETTTIASPLPLFFWEREVLVEGRHGTWFVQEKVPESPLPLNMQIAHISDRFCAWPNDVQLSTGGSQSDAFLLWTRAPFAERADDGSVLLRDARFYDPLARDRFTVALPDVKCEELLTE